MENISESKEYKIAKELEKTLNDYCFDAKKFVAAIPTMHPTLQQSLFRLLKECIIFMADEKNRYIDGRNRASYECSKKLVGLLQETGIPFI